jgi:tRNA pseudouridine synthase 10
MPIEDFREEIISAARGLDRAALDRLALCDSCLGRLVAKAGRGLVNSDRGALVRRELGIAPLPADCGICHGLSARFGQFADLAIGAFEGWEHGNFLIGTKFEQEVLAAEEGAWVETRASQTEPIKAEFNREIGKLVESRTGKPAEFLRPEIVAVIDTMYESVEVQVSPMYVYGRYRKFSREIPQTRWPCRACRGKGCERCGQTGMMYGDSVEEFVGRIALKHTGGKDHRFHGMGREDIDALMLGTGRPFVLEVKEPRTRSIDCAAVETEVNASTDKVQVSELRPSDADEVVRVKTARPRKSYRARVAFGTPVAEENLKEVVVSLGGTNISQQTPIRVMHRRSDLKRERRIEHIEARLLSPTEAELDITAEAGTYIKEFVHGDGGRTAPSISAKLGVVCEVRALDVLKIIE